MLWPRRNSNALFNWCAPTSGGLITGLSGRKVRLVDMMGSEIYDRDGARLVDPGLFIDLGAWRYNVFKLQSVGA